MANRRISTNEITVNETKIRWVAALVVLVVTGWFLIKGWVLPLLLLVDFLLRASAYGKFSPLGYISNGIIKQFNIAGKPIYAAPKKFAAKIGLLFSIVIFVASITSFHTTAFTAAAILALFALLEAAFGFCAGCYVFTFYSRLFVNSSSQPGK